MLMPRRHHLCAIRPVISGLGIFKLLRRVDPLRCARPVRCHRHNCAQGRKSWHLTKGHRRRDDPWLGVIAHNDDRCIIRGGEFSRGGVWLFLWLWLWLWCRCHICMVRAICP